MRRGGPELAQGGMPWPTGAQALIVRAAIGPEREVEPAFRAWRDQVDIDGPIDGGTYRLLPMVYKRMRDLGVDDPLMGRMKGVYRRSWVETHSLFHDMAPTVERLEAAGVQTLLLKGAPLALTYYRSYATRPMFDLDLVVPFPQRDEALRVLRDMGWNAGSMVRTHELPDQHGLDHRNASGRELDLHWRWLREAPADAADDWFWSGAERLEFCGVSTRQPSPTAMLVHLVAHGVRSNVEPPIRWIVDAATVIATASIDWPALVGFAKAQKLSYRLGLGLDYLARHYEAPVPEEILRELKAAGLSLIERMENIVYLGPAETMYRPRLYPLVDYWRNLRNQDPWTFTRGYPAYLQRRWQLGHALHIITAAVAALGRRMGLRWPA